MVSITIKNIMRNRHVTSKELAEYLNMSPQSLANKFSRNTWQVEELIKIVEFLDCKLVIQPNPEVTYILSNKE